MRQTHGFSAARTGPWTSIKAAGFCLRHPLTDPLSGCESEQLEDQLRHAIAHGHGEVLKSRISSAETRPWTPRPDPNIYRVQLS